jgi:GAF domain-containing protein/CheY-like chemotaxis protein/DNA/RNA endonuclease YhcR with UshA esterase domain
MVGSGKPGRTVARLRRALLLGTLLPLGLSAQVKLTLEQLNSRTAPDYSAVYAGQKVVIQGVVSAPALHFPDYSYLGIDDGTGGTLLWVSAPETQLDIRRPGDQIRVQGTVTLHYGTVTVVPERIELLGQKPVPAPIAVSLRDLQSFRYSGRLVHTEGRVAAMNDTVSGPSLTLAAPDPFWVFLPSAQGSKGTEFNFVEKGAVVEVTGIVAQYSPRPPFNRGFEILVNSPASVLRKERILERSLYLPPLVIGTGLAGILLVAFFIWSRERRLRSQRERLRQTYQLGEEILGASSAEAVLKRIAEALPSILGVTRVHLYVYNRAAKTLDGVIEQTGEAVSISLSAPPAGTQSGATACFHYRTLLVIPDIGRSPFPIATPDEKTPKSLLFVPMMAQGEVIGVMELDQDDRVRDFSADEQALAQHLGNQIGAALRLLGQRTVQEQLFRTEKLAAVGRLISGVVSELQTPLNSINELANRALEREKLGSAERDVAAIAVEAQKAAAMVARLVSFAAAEQPVARPVSISALLRNLIEFREGDWKASGIKLHEMISREPLHVLGSQGQLEQVFLNLLVHVEQSLAESPKKIITIRTSLMGKRLLIEISFSAPPEPSQPEGTAAILGVTRSVIAGHGGEIRLIEKPNTEPRFEVELPVAAKDRLGGASTASAPEETGRRRTALVIEPDDAIQRQLLALLSTRGYRVVPVTNADAGMELAQRMRFDAAFCSVHAPGLNWVELSERMHSRVGGFILLSESYDAELSADFEGEGRYVLPKPVQDSELDRVLRGVENTSANKVVSIRNSVA